MTWPLVFQIATFLVSAGVGIGLWLFTTGRTSGQRAQKQDDGEESTRAILLRLERRIAGEHDERKRLVEDINVKIGSIQIEQRGQREQVRALDDSVKELRRKVFNGGGMAGV